MSPLSVPTARYIMIGGFLGAGKTTSVGRLARRLSDRGLRVGLITNDQGNELADTTLLRSQGFATQEIAGGCFCCRFNSLMEAADALSNESRPEVFIAEPVGSCTDLVATVTYPLRRLYGDRFTIAPLSVVVDPVRALRVFGADDSGRSFSPKVAYIYRKQLEEADCIVLNKTDAVAAPDLARLQDLLARDFPGTRVFLVSARTGEGLDAWFAHLDSGDQQARTVMEVDYDTYADGEALLGWLNATVKIHAEPAVDGNALVRSLAETLQSELESMGAEIAHLKMTLSPTAPAGLGGLAAINLVRNDFIPELSQSLESPVADGECIINLRAEADPDQLHACLGRALDKTGTALQATMTLDHEEHFRPGRPVPTHRDVQPA